nr:respiratory burst oxidase homolog protein C-like [Tanacetum cinerariifolium]
MGTGDGADQKSFSGSFNKRGSRKSTRFDDTTNSSSAGGSMRSRNKDDYEITLDVGEDDMLAVHSVKTAEGVDMDDPESTLLGKELEKRYSFGRLVARSASAGIRHVSGELKKLASCSQPPIVGQSELIVGQSDRTKSAAINALTMLNFISTKTVSADGTIKDPWEAVEERFKKLTAKTTGLLPRALFGECIGMDKDSNDFAGELFDALSRRRNYKGYLINKTQMKEFWDQIVDESFDSRLQTFFDLVDKDANGQISKDEVQEIISLSASANKLSNIHTQADEYATMIMEELDRDGMDKDSNDFAGELFDALSRRPNYKGYLINKTQMKEFGDQIVDESFDSRVQTFFDL